jgi:aminotransferase
MVRRRVPLRAIISERQAELPAGEMGKLLKIMVEMPEVISLGPGEPDFSTPKHIIAAAKRALDHGFTHYSPTEGRAELREAITKKLKRQNRIDISPDQIIVTCGSTEAILLALLATIDPGEQVLIPDPGFLAYIPQIELLNAQALSVPTRPQDGWQLLPEAVAWQLKEPRRVRAIIINSPANPTGAVYTRKNLEQIADIAVDHDLLVITDEAYEHFLYGGAKHISMASLNGMADYVLTLQSFSKTYGMAGFRVGYAAGPAKIIDAMRSLHIYSTLCAPTVSQLAALAALRGPQGHIKRHVREYDRRRKFIIRRLNEIEGFAVGEPQGAFYAFARADFGMPSRHLCEWLIRNARVATVPGTDFGRYGEGFVRFSYATAHDLIVQAMDRIERAVRKLR